MELHLVKTRPILVNVVSDWEEVMDTSGISDTSTSHLSIRNDPLPFYYSFWRQRPFYILNFIWNHTFTPKTSSFLYDQMFLLRISLRSVLLSSVDPITVPGGPNYKVILSLKRGTDWFHLLRGLDRWLSVVTYTPCHRLTPLYSVSTPEPWFVSSDDNWPVPGPGRSYRVYVTC